MRIVDTDNYGGDYPDEHFVPFLAHNLTKEEAQTIADISNNHTGNGSRYLRVVENDYKLQPGFEP